MKNKPKEVISFCYTRRGRKMTDKEFLNWLADRLVHVYNESPNVDFVHKLKNIAKNIDANQCTPNLCESK